MRNFLLKCFWVVVLCGPLTAKADCQLVIDQDGSKATVFFIAATTNPDAVSLNSALNIPVQDENGKNAKILNFVDASGVQTVNVTCAFSQLIGTTGSCVLILYKSAGLTMAPASDSAVYTATGVDAADLAADFLPADKSGVIVASSDGHFSITSTHDSSGTVNSLTIQYH